MYLHYASNIFGLLTFLVVLSYGSGFSILCSVVSPSNREEGPHLDIRIAREAKALVVLNDAQLVQP